MVTAYGSVRRNRLRTRSKGRCDGFGQVDITTLDPLSPAEVLLSTLSSDSDIGDWLRDILVRMEEGWQDSEIRLSSVTVVVKVVQTQS